ncbi:MAG: alpha-galactosidase [Candidatus Helarchaeota archaeon]
MVSIVKDNNLLVLENKWERLEINIDSGLISAYDTNLEKYIFKNSSVSVRLQTISNEMEDMEIIIPQVKDISLSDDYKKTVNVEDITDEIGKGKKVFINQFNVEFQLILTLEITIYDENPGLQFQIFVENNGDPLIFIDLFPLIFDLDLYDSSLGLGIPENWKIFKIGYQSWSNTRIVSPKDSKQERLPSIGWARLTNYNTYNEPIPENQIRSNFFTAIKNDLTNENILFGFLTFKDQLSQFIFNFDSNKKILKSFKARSQADEIIINNNESIKSERLYILFSKDSIENLKQYFKISGEISGAKKWDHIITGFCTWYNYYQNISEDECIKNLIQIKSQKSNIPIEYFQLDDGYQIICGDWPEPTNKKFPNGMKNLVEKIKERGLKPGLWIAPFLVSPISKLYKEHPDWVIKNKNGKPIASCWNPNLYGGSTSNWKMFKGVFKPLYALDTTNPEVQTWLYNLFTKISKEWGFEYIKIDFIYAAALQGVRYEKVTRAQAYRQGIEIIRDAVGDDVFILGCGAPLGPSIGIVNGMRVSCDTAECWESFYSKILEVLFKMPPSLAVLAAMNNNLLLSFMHNNWWINDPDCLMVREKGSKLTLNEVQTEITAIGLTNGLYMISDNLTKLAPNRLKLIKKFIPIDSVNAIPLDLFDAEPIRSKLSLPKLYIREVNSNFDSWYIAGVFNWKDKPINNLNFTISDFGLEPNKKYHFYEYWSEKYLGVFEDQVQLPPLEKHSCHLLRICIVRDIPQLIGSGFHFLQGKAEIKEFLFDETTKKLTIDLNFYGHNKEKFFIYTPTRLYPYGSENEAFNCNCEILKSEPNYMIIQVEFTDNAKLVINLSKGTSIK